MHAVDRLRRDDAGLAGAFEPFDEVELLVVGRRAVGERGQRLRPSTVNRALVLEMIASAFISGVWFWLMTPQRVEIPEIKALVMRLIQDIDEVW